MVHTTCRTRAPRPDFAPWQGTAFKDCAGDADRTPMREIPSDESVLPERDLLGDEDLLTPEDLSRLIQIPVRTLAAWRSGRTGPLPLRLGVHVRYRRVDVDAWLASRAEAARDWMAS